MFPKPQTFSTHPFPNTASILSLIKYKIHENLRLMNRIPYYLPSFPATGFDRVPSLASPMAAFLSRYLWSAVYS
jgi:hypothetical protein